MKIGKIIGTLLLIGILVFIGYRWIDVHNQKEEVVLLLNDFREEHPEIDIPYDFNLKKEKEWDSGAVQYKLKKRGNNYHVLIENQEIVRIFTTFPDRQIYPKEQRELSKTEYAIEVSKLLSDALQNVQETQKLIQPETTINNEVVIQLDQSLQDSIQLYEDFKNIIPPADLEKIHQNLESFWKDYIVGEQGLVDQVHEVWNNTEDERQMLMDVATEKGKVVSDYSIELIKLISDFLGELTGISS